MVRVPLEQLILQIQLSKLRPAASFLDTVLRLNPDLP